ncbi:hypothetical protein PALB_9100 [Pseudoalteromonas luteoviolacea B = ATCC 29581]|nr:hypothetical protein PALB_9100 [Pseudoalteromonas luteoviolacea B = ATCC 29581]
MIKNSKNDKRNKLSIAASLSFLSGSSLFLPNFSNYAVVGVWLFIIGSLLMLIDSFR